MIMPAVARMPGMALMLIVACVLGVSGGCARAFIPLQSDQLPEEGFDVGQASLEAGKRSASGVGIPTLVGFFTHSATGLDLGGRGV
jgi:hypothetical protein